MQTFFLRLHSSTTVVVGIITIVALTKVVLGIVQKQSYDQLTRRLMLAFSGLTTAQWPFGIARLIALGDLMSDFGTTLER